MLSNIVFIQFHWRRGIDLILLLHLRIGIDWSQIHTEACEHHYIGLPRLVFACLWDPFIAQWLRGGGRRFLTPAEDKEAWGPYREGTGKHERGRKCRTGE